MRKASFLLLVLFLGLAAITVMGFVPFSGRLWQSMLPSGSEKTPHSVPKGIETLDLVRADWKEAPQAHVISLDVPGVIWEDINIEVEDTKTEVEENKVVRITGKRRSEKEVEGEKWHRAERTSGKFRRQFQLPANSDVDAMSFHLENGVLRLTVPKLAEEKRRRRRTRD